MTQWGLDTLFNPAKRHMDEEKRRLQSTREEIGDSSGGKRIDLESGKVTIRRSSDDAEESDARDGADTGEDASATDDGASASGDAPEGPAETGAAKTGAAKTGAAKTGAAKTGAAKTGAAKTGAAKKSVKPAPSAAAIRAARRRGRDPR